ncbi:MAG: DUF177 domain-containing protein [Burkholderiales bacterium]|nr:DUF177 domain-containing protein [Burkholderiales bacterium]
MSEQTVIDGFEFARMGRSLCGEMDIPRLGRLADLLYSNSGRVGYTLQGKVDAEGNFLLHLGIDGLLHLRCQRCLGEIEYPLDLQARLMIVKDEADLVSIEDEDPEVDSIVVKDKIDILPMVEDEILLELPFSLRHFECDVRESPFSILKGRI